MANKKQTSSVSRFILRTQNEVVNQDKDFSDFLENVRTNIEKSNSQEFTDPATIIEIGKTVYEIYKLFHKGESEIDKLIKEFRDKINRIFDLLNQVIDLLKKLEILIKEEARTFVRTGLHGETLAWMTNYESFKKDPKNERNLNEITGRYIRLQGMVYQAFDYGYGFYDTIGFAFAVEYSMARFLKKDDKTIVYIASNYRDLYFSKAINYDLDGSIANTLRKRFIEMKDLEGIYYAKSISCGIYVRDTGSRRGRVPYFEKILIIRGTIQDGFSYEEQDRPAPAPPSPPHDHEPRVARPILKHLFEWNEYTDPSAFKARYDEAHRIYVQIYQDSVSLTAAFDTCNGYINELNKIIK